MSESSVSLAGSSWSGYFKGVVKSLGVVFGDIGTSPIYTLSVIFFLLPAEKENVLGVLSLIIWTLVLLVSVGYAWLAMSLGKKGEGGSIVLRELLMPLTQSRWLKSIVTGLSFIGISLFFGDAVITPAVSILSAVEGILLIPAYKDTARITLILVACSIAVCLFLLQRKGTESFSKIFGFLMIIWFSALSLSGLISLIQYPSILAAFNPMCAISFFITNGFKAFIVLSGVILCATGGEAMYADMGHLGRTPIVRAWYFVFVALLLTYLGQGAFLLQNPESRFVLYEMIFHYFPFFYIPFLILSMFATVIASQAMISGIFSIVYQGITTNIMPMFRVDYTSDKLRSQVYIGVVNWFLMFGVILMIIEFRYARNLASAYGFAVTGTMLTTGIMMTLIFFYRRNFFKMLLAIGVSCIDLTYFLANMYKIPHGAYWSIIIASIPLAIILIYRAGERQLLASLKPMPLKEFFPVYLPLYQESPKHIEGTALYFVRSIKTVSSYVVHTMIDNAIIYEDNILISVQTRDDPFGVMGFFKVTKVPGFRIFEIQVGYMEVVDIEKILKSAGIKAKVMFYGLDEIIAKKALWKAYAFMKRLTPSFVQFHKLPSYKLHGVVRTIEM